MLVFLLFGCSSKTINERPEDIDDEIYDVFKYMTLEEKLQELKDIVVLKGAVDNTTILLFETKKRKKWFSMMRASCLSWFAGN